MKKTVLITGASGFVGANLTRLLLKQGYLVHIILRENSDLWRIADIIPKLKVYRGDLLDSDWMSKTLDSIKPQYIFHLAQYGGYPFQKETEKTWQTNFMTTVRLLTAAEKIGFKKFIYAGSSSEYGQKNKPMSETDFLEPNSAYAVSKASASLYCEHMGRDNKLPVTILRLFSVYGQFEEPGRLIPTILLRYLNNEKLELASPKIARDFIHIDDVCEAFIKTAIEKKANGRIINVGSGKQTTLGEVANTLSSIAGKDIPVIWDKTKGRSFETTKWVADTKRARKLLGWQSKIDFKTGLRNTLSWMKINKKFYENR